METRSVKRCPRRFLRRSKHTDLAPEEKSKENKSSEKITSKRRSGRYRSHTL